MKRVTWTDLRKPKQTRRNQAGGEKRNMHTGKVIQNNHTCCLSALRNKYPGRPHLARITWCTKTRDKRNQAVLCTSQLPQQVLRNPPPSPLKSCMTVWVNHTMCMLFTWDGGCLYMAHVGCRYRTFEWTWPIVTEKEHAESGRLIK